MARVEKGSSAHLSRAILEDLRRRVFCLSRPQQSGLCDLAACVLLSKTVNIAKYRYVRMHKILVFDKLDVVLLTYEWWSRSCAPL
jgi:hypothetical protein